MNDRTAYSTSTRQRAIGVAVSLVLALGLIAVAIAAGPAGAIPDTEAPTLHGGSLVESAGVVSDAPNDADRTLHFTASVSDNTTGMNYAYAQFISPGGNHYLGVSFSVPYAGAIITPVDVTGSSVLPRYSETGVWQLQSFSMQDVATNQVNLNQSQVAATGFPTSFIVSGTDDVTGPALTPSSSSISPGTPLQGDAADQSLRTFTIDTRVTDDLAGVQWISAQFQHNGQYAYPNFNLTSGDEHDGMYHGTATLPQYAASGTWQLSQVNMGDRVGNQTNLDAASAAALGFPSSFDVLGTDDLTPPTVQAFDFDPKSFNNVGCVTTVNVTAHVTDDVSGVAYLQGYFGGPAGQYHYVGLGLTSGTAADGVWTGSFSLPFESATGTWTLNQIYGADRANNSFNLSNGDLADVVPQTTFEVVAGDGEVCLSPDQTLSEGGGTGIVMASMTTQPAAPVDLALGQSPGAGASAGTQLTVAPTTVHFTPENWNVPQPVTVGAIDDGITEANPHAATVDGVTSSADPIFDGQTPSAKIAITEQSPTLAVTASPPTAAGPDGFSSAWSFTLANSGPGTASNPSLSVTVPTGSPGFTITAPGAMDSGFACAESVGAGSTVYTCTRSTNLNSGESATFSLTADANGSPGDAPTITAQGSADATATTPASIATAVATVQAPVFDLRVDNDADVGQVSTGGLLTWTATVTNTSSDGESASGIVLSYDLPAGVELASPPTMPGYTCVPPSGVGILTVTCSGGPTLAPGDKVSLTVPTTVTAPSKTTLMTTATANADQTDANPDDNTAVGHKVNVINGVDIVTTKTVSSASVMTGQSVTWTITATNTSKTDTAVSPGISDSLPGGLSPLNVNAPDGFNCSVGPSNVQCDAPSLAPGATAVLQFDTQIDGKTGSVFDNTAEAGAKNDTDSSNDKASASVKIAPSAAVQGTVTDAVTTSPLPNIQVHLLHASDLSEAASTNTAPDGTYTVTGLAVGDYFVQFTDGSANYGQQWYDHVAGLASASTVKVTNTSDDITGIDAALEAATQISGTVTSEADGTPLAGICVSAFDAGAPNFNNGPAAQTDTASDGTYTLTGLSSTPYIILFRDCSKQPTYALELYDGGSGTTDPAQAQQITPTGAGVDAIDAALGTGGSVSGTVFDEPTHTGLPNKCVVVFSPGFGALAIAQTASDGTYSIGGVPAGTWYVASGDCMGGDGTDFVWYAGATSIPVTSADDTADPVGDGAHLVTVVGGADTPDINLYFGTPAGGTGTVPTDPTGGTTPIAGNAKTTGATGPLAFTGMPGPALALAGLVLLGLGILAMRIGRMRRWRRSP